MKKILAFTILIGALSFCRLAFADDVEKLAQQIQESKAKVIDADFEKHKILGSLYTINRRMQKIEKDKSHLTDELFRAQSNAKGVAQAIAILEKNIQEQKKQLRERLQAAYKISGQSYLAILFSQTSGHNLDQTLKFLKIIAQKDFVLISQYRSDVAEYKLQKEKLKRHVAKLLKIEKGIKDQEVLLGEEQNEKSRIVSGLEKTRLQQISKIKGLRTQTQDSAFSEADSKSLMDLSFFEQKGQLTPPAEGPVIQDFGLIQDDKYKTQLGHKGWYFGVREGAPITSVFDGKVIFSSWIDGYGQTVIIDHDDHYYTVYAHTKNLKTSVGSKVHRGQEIAQAAATSRRFGSGFYFEIRHFSEPEDPRRWLNSSSLKVSAVNTKSLFTQGEHL